MQENQRNKISTLKELRLRYFAPIEIAKILGFPVDDRASHSKFELPTDMAVNSPAAYRVLGNSLSVSTVSFLTALLFLEL